jgi:integrase
MGSVHKTPAGTHRTYWRDPGGRQRSKAFKTAKAAKAFLADVETSLNRGNYVDPSAGKIRFRTFVDEWVSSRTVEATTEAATASRISSHLLPRWGDWPLNKIDHMAVQTWVADLSRQGLAPSTIASVFGNFATVLKVAVRNRLIAVNPCDDVRLPPQRKRSDDHETISRDELVHKLLPAVPELHRAIVATAAGAGLRWGECAGLRWPSLDLRAGTVSVVETLIEVRGEVALKPYPKSAAGRRKIPLADFAVETLDRHQQLVADSGAEWVFAGPLGGPQRRGNFRQRVWLPAVRRSGLTARLRFHDLRHCYATWLISDGVPVNVVQKLLGHSRASVTLDRYTHEATDYFERVRQALRGPAVADPLPMSGLEGVDGPDTETAKDRRNSV